jgi:hypothetical protein
MLEASGHHFWRVWVTDRLAELKRKLAARRGKPEYKDSVKILEVEIAALEAAK